MRALRKRELATRIVIIPFGFIAVLIGGTLLATPFVDTSRLPWSMWGSAAEGIALVVSVVSVGLLSWSLSRAALSHHLHDAESRD